MGVVSVHQYPIAEGKSVQQTVDNLSMSLELLGAKKVGSFLVDCETYYSAPTISPPRTLNIIHNSEQPATCYVLLDSGSCVTLDTNFDMLMLTLSSVYQTKKSSRMECKGPKMVMGDFIIKIGTVTIGPSFKGILVEVEYGPCSVASYCWAMMKEFMSSFMKEPIEAHPHLAARMNETFCPMDITQQYNEYFSSLRKATPALSQYAASTITEPTPTLNSPAVASSPATSLAKNS